VGTGQQVAVERQGVERAEEAQALNDLTDKRVYRDHPFCFQFAEGNMNCPSARSDVAKAIPRKVYTFADAHTGVAQEQEDVGRQVVAAEQLLLDGLILLRRQGTRQALGRTRRILATDQMGQLRELFGPSKFFQDAPQAHESGDVDRRLQ
jgi:hypothetical protein